MVQRGEEVVFNDTGVFGLSFFYLASAAQAGQGAPGL
jgi:hypothetical protein